MFFLFSDFRYYVALLAMLLIVLGKKLKCSHCHSQVYQTQIFLWEMLKRDLVHQIIASHTCDEKCPVGTPVQAPAMLP
jgi:hypothetical protein